MIVTLAVTGAIFATIIKIYRNNEISEESLSAVTTTSTKRAWTQQICWVIWSASQKPNPVLEVAA